jgi:hypothetical protein
MKRILTAPFRFTWTVIGWLTCKLLNLIPALVAILLVLAPFTFVVIGILTCICLLVLPFVALIDIVLKFTR